MKIKKKDQVLVIAGKDSGKKGEVLAVSPKENRVTVAGVNVVKKAVKPSKKSAQGGIIEVEKPIDVSNIAFICPSCGKPSRIGFQLTKKGDKDRVCKRCSANVKETK
jgi:large subunit ribosomal protein L24